MSTVTINLTKGLVATIDAEDSGVCVGRKWVASCTARKTYAVRGKGKTREYLHRLIVGACPGDVVDHIDGDTMNNRRSNLRICTTQQNSFNVGKIRGSSGFKGVTRHQDGKRWVARLTYCGRNLYLGLFDSPEDAARAYDREAEKRFGDFAWKNFS